MRVSIFIGKRPLLASLPFILLAVPVGADAQEAESQGRLAERSLDPIADLLQISLWSDIDMGLGKEEENDVSLTFEPRLPLSLVGTWDLIVWFLTPLESRQPTGPDEERENGVGDTVFRLIFAQLDPKPWRWGIGPVALIPTATRRALGGESFGLGGVATVRYQQGPWIAGLLAQHLHSVSGPADTTVQLGLVRPFVIFTTPSGVSLGLDSETTIDWEQPRGDRWLVPVQATVGQIHRIGKQQVNFQLGGRYFVSRPAGGPEWGLRLLVTFLFPVEPVPAE